MKLRRYAHFYRVWLVLAAAVLFLAACKDKPLAVPVPVGRIVHAAATETSGLAASHRASDLLWIHNDSAGQPVLYAIGTDGRLRGSVRIAGVKNIDWEDIASFELDGQAWLLIADTGDNNGTRKNCALYVIAEPDRLITSSRQPLPGGFPWCIQMVHTIAKPWPSTRVKKPFFCSQSAPSRLRSTRCHYGLPPKVSQ